MISRRIRIAICLGFVILCTTGFYRISLRLIAQIHVARAESFFQRAHYGASASHLKKADVYQPDDYSIQKDLGKVWLKLGELAAEPEEASERMQKAKDFYVRAARLNPLDAEAVYGLAKGEASLELLYRHLHPGTEENPYHALPYFKEAIRLRPNGILYSYALARYLYQQKQTDDLLATVRELARIYPPAYHYLRREAFWSPSVKEACKNGLEDAVRDDISPRDALMGISQMMGADKIWVEAMTRYQDALAHRSFENHAGNYIHMGSLCLKNGSIEEAETAFFDALRMSRSKEKILERIYPLYKRYTEERLRFYRRVITLFELSHRMDILMARALIDLKRHQEAKDILESLNRRVPHAEAYYWLARIAEREKDWDVMELAIQKATVLDPKNRHYRKVFSDLLRHLKKN